MTGRDRLVGVVESWAWSLCGRGRVCWRVVASVGVVAPESPIFDRVLSACCALLSIASCAPAGAKV